VTIDQKYPQAIGIESILRVANTLGNFKWEILKNDFRDSQFFTSDFPIVIERTSNPKILNRIVPLAPNLAVRIRPDLSIMREEIPDLSFKNFGFRIRNIDRQEINKINQLIVRCAEDIVFYRDDHPWIQSFITKNRRYRIEPYTQKVPIANGIMQISTQRVVATG
jgi:hypothetical protein